RGTGRRRTRRGDRQGTKEEDQDGAAEHDAGRAQRVPHSSPLGGQEGYQQGADAERERQVEVLARQEDLRADACDERGPEACDDHDRLMALDGLRHHTEPRTSAKEAVARETASSMAADAATRGSRSTVS